jgi:hypothetical protein
MMPLVSFKTELLREAPVPVFGRCTAIAALANKDFPGVHQEITGRLVFAVVGVIRGAKQGGLGQVNQQQPVARAVALYLTSLRPAPIDYLFGHEVRCHRPLQFCVDLGDGIHGSFCCGHAPEGAPNGHFSILSLLLSIRKWLISHTIKADRRCEPQEYRDISRVQIESPALKVV